MNSKRLLADLLVGLLIGLGLVDIFIFAGYTVPSVPTATIVTTPTISSTYTPTAIISAPEPTGTQLPVWNREGRDYLLPFPGTHISPYNILKNTGYYSDLALQMARSVDVSFPYNAVKGGIAFKYCDGICIIFFGDVNPDYWTRLTRHEYGHIFAYYYQIDLIAFALMNQQLKHPLYASYHTEEIGEIYASAQEISPCELKRRAGSLISFFPQYKVAAWSCQ